jgi:hypothetical protein
MTTEVGESTILNQKNDMKNDATYVYHFDYPLLSESGLLQIESSNITLRFPDKKNYDFKDHFVYNQDVNLIINNQCKFSYQWLPIFTSTDFCRIKDMLYKLYAEYAAILNFNDCQSTVIKYYDEVITHYNTEFYSLLSFENRFITRIEITIHKNKIVTNNEKIYNFEIFVGSNSILSVMNDFKELPTDETYFLALFILKSLCKL